MRCGVLSTPSNSNVGCGARMPLAERSSMARKTICFSKSIWLCDVVIGLFINHYESGLLV